MSDCWNLDLQPGLFSLDSLSTLKEHRDDQPSVKIARLASKLAHSGQVKNELHHRIATAIARDISHAQTKVKKGIPEATLVVCIGL